MSNTDTINNCWTCDFQNNWGNETFLGRCSYFTTQGKAVKDIPANVVDKGCKFWKVRTAKKTVAVEEE